MKETAPRNLQTDAYRKARPLKQHEQEMLELIQHDHAASFSGCMLDIGCAAGATLKHLRNAFPHARLVGIDISEELIDMGRESVGVGATFHVVPAEKYQPDACFDVIIASGILSVFEDFQPALTRWLSWLSPGGRMYVFGRFNSRDVDTIVRFRNHSRGGGWETGLTSYALRTVGGILRVVGASP